MPACEFKRQQCEIAIFFFTYRVGESIEELARRYKLSIETVGQIIRGEKHQFAVSIDAFYRAMRSQKTTLQREVKLKFASHPLWPVRINRAS